MIATAKAEFKTKKWALFPEIWAQNLRDSYDYVTFGAYICVGL
jgi:hypothetical protein